MKVEPRAPGPAAGVRTPWWTGARGEWLVAAQITLMGLVAFGPRTVAGRTLWPFPFASACRVLGTVSMIGGAALVIAGVAYLGRALTPLPYPRQAAPLTQGGAFRFVRHPMYSGGLAVCFGWALHVQSGWTFLYAVALFVLLDVKSRREERWLADKFPAYAAYRKRVRKLVPFIY